MSSSNSANYESVYIFLGVLIFLVIRRTSRVIRGSRVSRSRGIAFSIYYFAFAALLIAVSVFSGGVSAFYVALYAVVGLAGGYGAYLFSNTRIAFWKGGDGATWVKGAVLVYFVYLIALIIRIAVDLVFIGPQAFAFTATTGTLSASAVDAGIVADFFLALGAGMLIGRNIRVLNRYKLILAGTEKVPDTEPRVSLF